METLFLPWRAMEYLTIFWGKYIISKKKEWMYVLSKILMQIRRYLWFSHFCENIHNFRYKIKDGTVVKIVRLWLILTFVCHTDVLLVGVAGHIVPPVVHIVCLHTVQNVERINSIFLGDFLNIFFVLYSTLLHLPPLRFHCADGCWKRTQDRCNWCIGSQTL